MLNYLLKLKRNSFVKNVTVVASGTVIAQAIAMLSTPIIARLYGPENIGILGVFVAMTGIVAKVSGLTYPVAIVLPKEEKDAKLLVQSSIFLSIIMAVLTAVILLFFSYPIAKIFNLDAITNYLYFIPLIIIFSTLLQVSEQWLIRIEKFKLTAKAVVYKSLIVNISKIGVGFFHPVAFVLILITSLGYLLHAWLIVNNLKLKVRKNTLKLKNNVSEMLTLLKYYKDFPLYRAPQELVNGISSSMPVLLLASFFGPAYAGFYSISRTILKVPTELLSKSIGDVFYPRITQAANRGERISNLLLKSTVALTLVGLIPFGVAIALGPWLFGLILGEDWVQAGEYARWLSLWLFFGFVNRPSTKSIPVLRLQGWFLFYEILTTAFRAGALFVGFLIYNDDLIAIILMSVIASLSNIWLVFYTYYKAKRYDKVTISKVLDS